MRLEVHVQATSEMGRQIRPSITSCDEEPKIVGEQSLVTPEELLAAIKA